MREDTLPDWFAQRRTYVTGSPMAEVLHNNLAEIEAPAKCIGVCVWRKGKYILLSAIIEENIDTEKNFMSLFNAINRIWPKSMICRFSIHVTRVLVIVLQISGFQFDSRVIQHEPLGFHDYNCLQMNALCSSKR